MYALTGIFLLGYTFAGAGDPERARRTEPAADRRAAPPQAFSGRRDRRAVAAPAASGLEAPARSERRRARRSPAGRPAADLSASRAGPEGARRLAGSLSAPLGGAIRSARRRTSRSESKRQGEKRWPPQVTQRQR